MSYQKMGESPSLNSLDTQTGMVVGETNFEFLIFVILGVIVFALYPLAVMCVLACVHRFLVGLKEIEKWLRGSVGMSYFGDMHMHGPDNPVMNCLQFEAHYRPGILR
jgi:hypothetical protein